MHQARPYASIERSCCQDVGVELIDEPGESSTRCSAVMRATSSSVTPRVPRRKDVEDRRFSPMLSLTLATFGDTIANGNFTEGLRHGSQRRSEEVSFPQISP